MRGTAALVGQNVPHDDCNGPTRHAMQCSKLLRKEGQRSNAGKQQRTGAYSTKYVRPVMGATTKDDADRPLYLIGTSEAATAVILETRGKAHCHFLSSGKQQPAPFRSPLLHSQDQLGKKLVCLDNGIDLYKLIDRMNPRVDRLQLSRKFLHCPARETEDMPGERPV